MKKLFPGYFRPTGSELNRIWEDALIAFDANVLLNLYRYSSKTKEEFLKILERFEEKLILPNRAAYELLTNRLNVIENQGKCYQDVLGEIKKLEERFSNSREHPFLSQSLLNRLIDLFGEVKAELTGAHDSHLKQITEDGLLTKLNQIFEDRTLPGFSKERLEKIITEGEQRYAQKVPPGYKDASKSDDSDPVRKFGDFIIWQELLDLAKERKKPVIFVSDDKKEDWWLEARGQKLGPRPELIAEFREHADQMFYMYAPDRFLKWASEHVEQQVDPAALNEVREVQEMPNLDWGDIRLNTAVSATGRVIPGEESLLKLYADMLIRAKAERPHIFPSLQAASSIELIGDTYVLVYSSDRRAHAENLRKDANKIFLEQVLSNYDLKFATAIDDDPHGIDISFL